MNKQEILKKLKEKLASLTEESENSKKQVEQERRDLVTSLGKDISDMVGPAIASMSESGRMTRDDLGSALREALSDIQINVPEPRPVTIPPINIPAPKVSVTVPPITVPKSEVILPDSMSVTGNVGLKGVDKQNPLPVVMMDVNGKPMSLPLSLGGAGGGKTDFFTIKGFGDSAYADYLNADNRLKVSVETGSSGLTDTELRASAVDVKQVSGSVDSVIVNSGTITTVTTVTSVTNSLQATIIDSSGVGYSGSNPFPTTIVSGALTSTVAVGAAVSDAVDDGSAPVKGGGIARTTQPAAVADGDIVTSTHDKLGRQVTRNTQVRNLISTAYVSLTNGTETTLLAGVAGSYLDLMYLLGTNSSDVAVTVDVRAVTSGNIQTSLRIPANGTAGVALSTPIPQDETGNNWTVDGPDETGRTITVSALFSREI